MHVIQGFRYGGTAGSVRKENDQIIIVWILGGFLQLETSWVVDITCPAGVDTFVGSK